MTDLTRHTVRAASLTLITALAACGDSGQDKGASKLEATNTQQQTATAAPSSPDRVNLSQCAEQSDGRVYFQVGATTLSVPGPTVRDAIPASLSPPLSKEAVKQELQSQAAAGGGCEGKPISANLLILQDNLDHPLLDGKIGLLSTPPQGITAQFAEVTGNLQQKPTKNCRQMGTDLLGCVGRETRGNVQTQVMYLITTDRNARMSSGGPLAARCVLENNQVQGCNLVDQLPGNVAFDATLKPGTYTTAGLSAARDAAAAKVNSYRTN